MTVGISYRVEDYDLDRGLSLLSPADFGESGSQGCLDRLALIVKQLALYVLRWINYVCGDREWYDNQAACQIVERYFAAAGTAAGERADCEVRRRVELLYHALEFRANGSISCAESIQRGLSSSNQLAILLSMEECGEGIESESSRENLSEQDIGNHEPQDNPPGAL